MKKLLLVMLSLLMMLGGSGCSKTALADETDDNYRVFYQIFVGSFSDSNGDGYGDLQGIINRFDYLNDGNLNSETSLHVQGIWLSPIFKSKSYHKYDVTDYYTIDDDFGTMDDLKELIELAHSRNVKIILDLVLNHTSDLNEAFGKFVIAHRQNNTDDPYYDYYSWVHYKDKLKGHTYRQIDSDLDEYYECNFSTDMPELNYDNPQVREDMLEIAKYYLDLGVDGFRFDAAKYIYYLDNEKSVAFWDEFMDQLKAIKEDIYCVGEVWSADSETNLYVSEMNCFNFTMAQPEGVIASAAKGNAIDRFTGYVASYQSKITTINSEAMPIFFIANHDMDRAAGYLNTSSKNAYMAANLYLLCCGSPFIYYGEEIGLKGSRGSASTDANRRLAMLWGDGDTVQDPEGATFLASKQNNGTVEEQNDNEDSLLNYYRKLIAFRIRYPQIARGSYSRISFGVVTLGGFTIEYNNETTILIHNTADEETSIDLSDYNCSELLDYIGQGKCSFKDQTLVIGPKTSAVLQ